MRGEEKREGGEVQGAEGWEQMEKHEGKWK